MLNIGIDLGGTKIAAGVVDEEGKILCKASIPTGAGRPADEIIKDMADLAQSLLADNGFSLNDICHIGIGSPGIINRSISEVVFASNLCWHNVPVKRLFESMMNKPVFLENDANTAAVAELMVGAGKGYSDIVLLTLGTGVGGGIIINNSIISGSHGIGAEIGHFIIHADGMECPCGNKGCFERYASASALINWGVEALKENPGSLIYSMACGNPANVTAQTVVDSAKQKDPAAMEIFERYIKYLALGIISIINIIDPQVIVLGGGVSKAGEFLLDAVRAKTEELLLFKDLPHANIELSTVGNDAGIIGAAFLDRMTV